MSQMDEVAHQNMMRVDMAVEAVRKRAIDWPVLVVALASVATCAWIYVLVRVSVRTVQFLLA